MRVLVKPRQYCLLAAFISNPFEKLAPSNVLRKSTLCMNAAITLSHRGSWN